MTTNLSTIAPALFVLLWSTGFIGAKYALPYAEPFTLLFVRFVIALLFLFTFVLVTRQALPKRGVCLHLGVSGALIHGGYLGGLFYAIELGMSPAMCALLVGLQPLLTTAVTPVVFGRRVPMVNWIGVVLGLVGIGLTLTPSMSGGFGEPLAWVAAVIALLGITIGTIYQKTYGKDAPLLGSTAVQYISACVIFAAGSLAFETGNIEISPQFIAALLWLSFGLSIGAVLLLLYLIRGNEAHRVASLFYLVPPVTAIESYFLFNERLSVAQLVGIALVALAVYLASLPDPAENR